MTVLQSLRSAFSTFRAAIHAASAVEMHKIPSARDLGKLGIDRAAFQRIHL
ncbi:hypothetical protein RM190_14475 [Paracoccus sp. CPCC 101403]|uniref:DUF1127 domain-containing protein n=2 Tax=Paracoccus broussonetiae TaxID=3075834 RepID=A0ABU3EFQ8_9RHOB|nr:hypothetical protein [Paracoccus sp. CPCC 101403]MDT1063079.1 hypothetical protein [Paracoccus sp. CPCC 101403]